MHSKGKKIGLESALLDMRGLENTLGRKKIRLESALKRKKIGLESELSGGQGLENALERKRDRARKYII